MSIEDWRNEIDAIDRELLRLLNMRARIAVKVGELKTAAGLPISDEERESGVLAHVHDANSGPLDEQSIGRIFRRIIRESRRTQERVIGKLSEQLSEVIG